MVVDGRHLEQALAVGRLEIGDLQNIGHGFTDIHEADQNQNQGHLQREGHGAHHAA